MAGNSKRRGAIRKPGSKKGPQVGSGGQRRRALEGRGPTPKATERTGHPAAARKAAAEKAAQRKAPARKTSAGVAGGRELVAGRNAVLEAVRAGVPVDHVYLAVRADADERVGEVLRTATARNLPVLEAAKNELDRLTEGANHQGIAIQVPPYEYADPGDLLDRAAGTPLIVALDGVTDPHNLGAVLRSAGAFGIDGVLVPERRAAGVTAAVWRVSAGAVARVPVARATNLVRALEDYKKAGCFVVGLDGQAPTAVDRKSTRLNSSHVAISYAVLFLQ